MVPSPDSGSPANVDVCGKRILFMSHVRDNPVMPEVAAALRRVANNFVGMGHSIEEGDAPFDADAVSKYGPLVTQAGLAWLLRDKDWRGKVNPFYTDLYERGAKLSAADYIATMAELRRIQSQVGAVFDTFDLILSPITGSPAWGAEEMAKPNFNVFTNFVNIANVPGISIPAAISSDGRPIGFQLVGRFGSDWKLIALARQYEARHGWQDRWPPI